MVSTRIAPFAIAKFFLICCFMGNPVRYCKGRGTHSTSWIQLSLSTAPLDSPCAPRVSNRTPCCGKNRPLLCFGGRLRRRTMRKHDGNAVFYGIVEATAGAMEPLVRGRVWASGHRCMANRANQDSEQSLGNNSARHVYSLNTLLFSDDWAIYHERRKDGAWLRFWTETQLLPKSRRR